MSRSSWGLSEHAIDCLVDTEIDLSEFEAAQENDETGAPGIRPGILSVFPQFTWQRSMINDGSFIAPRNLAATILPSQNSSRMIPEPTRDSPPAVLRELLPQTTQVEHPIPLPFISDCEAIAGDSEGMGRSTLSKHSLDQFHEIDHPMLVGECMDATFRTTE